jgi:hypothetical protein
MLWALFALLFLLWLVFGVAAHNGSALIHLLLVGALIVLVVNLLSRRKPAV